MIPSVERFPLEDTKRSKSDCRYRKHIEIPSGLHTRINSSRKSLIYAIYKKDTMIIDANIMTKNFGGHRGSISKLKIQQGNFHLDKLDKKLSEINLEFLKDKNVSYKYYLSHSYRDYSNKEFTLAKENLNKAVRKNGGKKTCEMLKFFSDLSAEEKDFGKAIKYLTKAIKNKCNPPWRSSQYRYYLNRIDLYIKNNDFHNALKDYNTIVDKYPSYPNDTKREIERAYFKLIYLKNYDEIIEEMTVFMKKNIDKHRLDGKPYENSLAQGLFVIGAAEYFKGNKKKAFKHWFNFMDYSFRIPVVNMRHFFSKLIDKNPLEPELYLLRSSFYDDDAFGSYQNEENLKLFRIALEDIAKAEKLGLNHYKINYNRSYLLSWLKKEKKAYKEIKKALKKEPNNLKCLRFKAQFKESRRLQDKYSEKLKQIDLKKLWFD